jgi:AmmeMemoRadiSam system protein A
MIEETTGTNLTGDERAFLRELARRAVSAAAHGEAAPDPEALARERGLPLSERLRGRRGAFVTLHEGDHLRGCIGMIEGHLPLVHTVVDNARAAAVDDPRFPPVTPDELSNITIEVSALTPLRAVDGPDGIEVGRHGVLLQKHGRQAVFLPQVATEQGWDLPTTLSHLCRKAGLPADAWREGADLHVFEAEVF